MYPFGVAELFRVQLARIEEELYHWTAGFRGIDGLGGFVAHSTVSQIYGLIRGRLRAKSSFSWLFSTPAARAACSSYPRSLARRNWRPYHAVSGEGADHQLASDVDRNGAAAHRGAAVCKDRIAFHADWVEGADFEGHWASAGC